MLLILIPLAWLAVVTLFVAVCQASALGESSAVPAEDRAYRIHDGLVVWDRNAAIALRYRRRSVARRAAFGRGPGAAKPTSRRVALRGLH